MALAALRHPFARLLRRFSTVREDGSDKLSKWLREWLAVPRVVVPEGTEPPTALSWLRRRGPPLPQSVLHRLFRQGTVRVYDPTTQRVGRASKGRVLLPGSMLLLPGSMLLLPKGDVAAAGSRDGGGGGGAREEEGEDSTHAGSTAGPRRPAHSPVSSPAAQRWLAELRSGLLLQGPDFLAINKPAGLACQGGSGLALSLDSLMGPAFEGLPGVRPGQLRLVHRLDMQTTGVLLIAKDPDAAAWLAAAFKEGSLSRSSSGGSSSTGRAGGPLRRSPAAAGAAAGSIRKTYWAVVAREEDAAGGAGEAPAAAVLGGPGRGGRSHGGTGSAWLPHSGSIRLPVPSSKDPSAVQPAETRFSVLHQGPRLAWVELEPLTGRKHQLRLHCSQGLGAAILGDARYGTLRSGAQQAALAKLRTATATGAAGGHPVPRGSSGGGQPPLFLHCRSLSVLRPSGKGAASVVAPLPRTWQVMLQQQGWPLPAEPLGHGLPL